MWRLHPTSLLMCNIVTSVQYRLKRQCPADWWWGDCGSIFARFSFQSMLLLDTKYRYLLIFLARVVPNNGLTTFTTS